MTQKRVLSIWGLALVLAVGVGSCSKQEDGAQAPRYLPLSEFQVEPETTIDDFKLSSSYSPGFTLVYARSADQFALPEGLPDEVLDQLSVLYEPQWFNKSYLTIGPRYPKGWSKQFIAADFAQAIDRLARTGELDAAAPFVTAALTSLRLFLATQGAFATPALTFLGQAETTLERSIARWMEMSLK